MRTMLVVLASASLAVACQGGSPATPSASAEPRPVAAPPATSAGAPSGKLYGAPLATSPVTALSEILKSPASYEGKTITCEGAVRQACTRKGCWMEIAESMDKSAGGARVTFKDYGFFVPLDSAGSTAKVEGTVKVAELSAEKAKHYEAEGAKVAKDKDGKFREVQLVAVGVELRK